MLVILTSLGVATFNWLRRQQHRLDYSRIGWGEVTLGIMNYALLWDVFHRAVFTFFPALLMDSLFRIMVMQTLLFLPFFMLDALVSDQRLAVYLPGALPADAALRHLYYAANR